MGDSIQLARNEQQSLEPEEAGRAIGEALPYGPWTADSRGRATYFSPSFQKLLGASSPEQLFGFQWIRRLDQPDRLNVLHSLHQSIRSGMPVDVQFRVTGRNGRTRTILCRAAPVHDADCRIVKWAGFNLDITDREKLEQETAGDRARLDEPVQERLGELVDINRQLQEYLVASQHAEEALRESEEMYHQLVESAATVIMRIDPEGKVTFLNEFAQQLFGYSTEEILGRPVLGTIVPEKDSQGRDLGTMMQDILQNPQQYQFNENENICRDGRRVWVAWRNRPKFAPDGTMKEMICVGVDITRRKEIEEALRDSEEKFRALADNAQMIVGIVQGTHFTYVNPYLEHLSGYSREELCAMNIEQIVHPDWRETVLDRARRRMLGENVPTNYEFVIVTKTGEDHWLDFSPARIELKGQPAIIGVAYDITERKRVEQELRQTAEELSRSNLDLEQFAYIVSHDLQEPLRMVSSYVELLRRRYESVLGEEGKEFIAYAVDGSNRMSRLIKDLLDYSRAARQPPELVEVDMQAALERASADLWGSISESGTTLTHDPLPTVWADETQLSQLLMNLIGNAIKFRGDRPPEIHVGSQRREEDWLFWVADNGIGMDAQQAQRLFVIFQRVHDTKKYPGSGVGLAICKKIVERHGGRIWVESEVDRGSTFYFTIPRRARPRRQAG